MITCWSRWSCFTFSSRWSTQELKSNINYKQKRGKPVQSSHNYSTFTKHHITSHFRSESSDAYWKSLENKYYIFFDYGILAYTGPIRYHNINIINIISSHWYESCGVWRFFLAHWESSTPVLSMVTKFVTGKHCITMWISLSRNPILGGPK